MKTRSILTLLVFLLISGGSTFSQTPKTIWKATKVLSIVNQFLEGDSGLYAFGDTYDLLLSTDHGMSWSHIFAHGLDGDVHHLVINGKYFFGGSTDGFFFSDFNGEVFNKRTTSLTKQRFWPLTLLNGKLIAGTEDVGLIESDDNAKSWKLIGTGIVGAIRDMKINANKIFASGDSGLFVSLDGANTWSRVAGLPIMSISQLVVNGNTVLVNHKDSKDIYYSLDNGIAWSLMNTDFIVKAIAIGNFGIIGGTTTQNGDVFLSKNNGITWQDICGSNVPIEPNQVSAITISGPNIVVGSLSGRIWYTPIDSLLLLNTVNEGIHFETKFTVTPNPSDGLITITSTTKEDISFTCNIYNELGVKTTTHSDAEVFHNTYSTHLTPGVYHAHIESKGKIYTTKFVVY